MTNKMIKELNIYMNTIQDSRHLSMQYIRILDNISMLPTYFKFNRGPYQYLSWYFLYYFYNQELK